MTKTGALTMWVANYQLHFFAPRTSYFTAPHKQLPVCIVCPRSCPRRFVQETFPRVAIRIPDRDAIIPGGGLSNIAGLYDEGRARVARHMSSMTDSGPRSCRTPMATAPSYAAPRGCDLTAQTRTAEPRSGLDSVRSCHQNLRRRCPAWVDPQGGVAQSAARAVTGRAPGHLSLKTADARPPEMERSETQAGNPGTTRVTH